MLLASGLKLLDVPDVAMVTVLAVVVVIGPLLWMAARARHGLPPRPRIVQEALRRRPPAETVGVGPPAQEREPTTR